MSRRILLFIFILFSATTGYAQLSIDFPTERAVFQRNNFNEGYILVQGTTSLQADRVEARLIPVEEGQGIETNWKIVDNDLKGGSFSGKIRGEGGWYVVEIRLLKDNLVIGFESINKVGIGEVFLVSGQSNAQGFLHFNPKGATDDRVNGYSEYRLVEIEENPPLTAFSHISRELDIGPHGQSAWAWGELGDELVKKFNVPVLFFNAAYEGTNIENWTRSIKGLSTVHTGFGFTFPQKQPYDFMRTIFQNHVPLYGLRAVIWIQGESDSETSETDYYERLKFFIEEVNKKTGKDVPWILSKTSLVGNISYPHVTRSQNRVIKELSNVFNGPDTDQIQIPRGDGVHFSDSGISDLAESFGSIISPALLSQIRPIVSDEIINLEITCLANDVVRFSTNKSGFQHIWNGSVNNKTIDLSTGFVDALVRDNFGNYHLTEKMIVESVLPSAPVITALDGISACEGEILRFSANNEGYITEWQDGSRSPIYYTTSSELVFAKNENLEGCKSEISNSIQTEVFATPAPVITALDGVNACEGEILRFSANNEGYITEWQDGSKSPIYYAASSELVFAKNENLEGCKSEISNSIQAKVFAPPAVAQIVSSTGSFGLCETASLNLIAESDEPSFLWSNGETTKEIKVIGVGEQSYTVRAISKEGCMSEFSELKQIEVYGLPAPPTIVQSGPFLLGISNSELYKGFQWVSDVVSLTEETSSDLHVTNEGFYAISGFEIHDKPLYYAACESKKSGWFNYVKNPKHNGIEVYPNPVIDGQLYITSDVLGRDINLELKDYQGKTIIHSMELENLVKPERLNFPSSIIQGNYILILNYEGLEERFKLIFR